MDGSGRASKVARFRVTLATQLPQIPLGRRKILPDPSGETWSVLASVMGLWGERAPYFTCYVSRTHFIKHDLCALSPYVKRETQSGKSCHFRWLVTFTVVL